jgi:hypothetical protein
MTDMQKETCMLNHDGDENILLQLSAIRCNWLQPQWERSSDI